MSDSSSNPSVPRHVAIIMDGNGRWARQRHLPRVAGHRKGVETVRLVVRVCLERGIRALTLFAFSSENWRRPKEEVGLLLDLFVRALEKEARKLHQNGVRLRVIGDRSAFPEKLQARIAEAEALTRDNQALDLVIAANYGGRWDIAQAAQRLAQRVATGELKPEAVTEQALAEEVTLSDLPEPDLFIRTGGEQRVSNFLLWQLAYTELWFTATSWPDFDSAVFEQALQSYGERERRFGRTSEQVMEQENGA